MPVEAFRVQNFMGFEESGWIELRPITLLLGRNSSGKSAILRALLLLQQSLDGPPETGPLSFVKDEGFDYGDYGELVRDHDTRRTITFWFLCRLPRNGFEDSLDALRELDATESTVKFGLTYGRRPHESRVALHKLDLLDALDDTLLRATAPKGRNVEGSPWTFKSDFVNLEQEPDPRLWTSLQLFTGIGFLPWIRSLEGYLILDEQNRPQLGKTFNRFWYLLRDLRSIVTDFLSNVEYLGPLRAEPQRFYYTSGRASAHNSRARQTVRTLTAQPDSLDKINEWLERSCLHALVELKALDKRKTLYELRVVDVRNPEQFVDANVREVGFGISQILPVIAQTILAAQESTVCIEQPELHLHPSAQAELGDLFGQAMNQKRFLLETHSENLLLRLRRRLAQSTSGVMEANAPLIRHEDLRVYFVDRMDGVSQVDLLEFDEWGDYVIRPQRFGDFFGQDFEELIKMKNARRAAKSDQ